MSVFILETIFNTVIKSNRETQKKNLIHIFRAAPVSIILFCNNYIPGNHGLATRSRKGQGTATTIKTNAIKYIHIEAP
jgi:hypothetical protein